MSVSSVIKDVLSSSCSGIYSSSSCSGSVSDIISSSSAVSLGKPSFPVLRPLSGLVASVGSGESGRVTSRSVVLGVSGLGDSRSGSSASKNTCSLEVELSSEFIPKVPRRLGVLDVVVSEFARSRFLVRQAEQRVEGAARSFVMTSEDVY